MSLEKQEPVGYLFDFTCDDELVKDWFVLRDYPTVWEESAHNIRPLYTLSQPEWQTLTDDDIAVISGECALVTPSDLYFARAIEAKLKEKNT